MATIAMTPLERKAAFVYLATLKQMTLEAASKHFCGVIWFHLSQGIAGLRPLGPETKRRFAEAIGKTVDEVFGEATSAAA